MQPALALPAHRCRARPRVVVHALAALADPGAHGQDLPACAFYL
jgi:hypothetical protein